MKKSVSNYETIKYKAITEEKYAKFLKLKEENDNLHKMIEFLKSTH